METSAQAVSRQEESVPAAYTTVGTSPIRPDGVDKVTGRAQFGADIHLPGMLYGVVLRSPHAHARIVAIDTRVAEALPGVKAVMTAHDLAAQTGAPFEEADYASQQIVAHGKALYYGHAVAAVAATNRHIAEEAAKLIRVDYEVLPHVLEAEEAMREDAPILHETLRTDALGRAGDAPTNIAGHYRTKRGDVEAGFAQAHVVVERTFHTQTVHQGYIEPNTATAVWGDDGRVQIWCSTQGSHSAREQVAAILHLPQNRISVTPTEIGGGFGGKNDIYLEPLAALLSRKAGGRPVKMVMTRADVLAATGPGAGSTIKIRMGVDRQGIITAAQAFLAYDAGGFPGGWVSSGCGVVLAPYRLENVQIDGYDVVVNKPKTASYRGPGATNAVYAAETVIDELAEAIGMDPLDFRLLNGAVEGDRRPDGMRHLHMGYLETLKAAKAHPHYQSPLEGPNRGRGVASTFWGNWGARSSVSAGVNGDGTVNLVVGSVDLSTSRTAVAMQLAETLAIPLDSGGGERGRHRHRRLQRHLRRQSHHLCNGSGRLRTGQEDPATDGGGRRRFLGSGRDQVVVDGETYSANGERLTFSEIAKIMGDGGRPVTASASVNAVTYGGAAAVHIVDVEVDPETGKVTILRYTALQDVGTAIHPAYVEGQIQGGAVQGIGWALNEGYWYDEHGRLGQRQPARLPHAHRARSAHDRHFVGGEALSWPPFRRARRRRIAHHPARRRNRQRHLPRHRRADDANCPCRRIDW